MRATHKTSNIVPIQNELLYWSNEGDCGGLNTEYRTLADHSYTTVCTYYARIPPAYCTLSLYLSLSLFLSPSHYPLICLTWFLHSTSTQYILCAFTHIWAEFCYNNWYCCCDWIAFPFFRQSLVLGVAHFVPLLLLQRLQLNDFSAIYMYRHSLWNGMRFCIHK